MPSEMMSCGCKKKCDTKKCACVSNGLLCTDMCKCDSCVNRTDDEEVFGDDEGEWDYYDDDDINDDFN